MRRIVFMGTPDFAVPTFNKLIENKNYDVVLALCQPDKPKGRSKKPVAPPIKEAAQKASVEVFQPNTLKTDEVQEYISSFKPDFIVVAAYGKILPKAVLEIPKKACINVHGSLLPKYRGAAPIQWAVLNGEKQTGVTTMLMAEGLDSGDMLLKSATEIGEHETAPELFERLSQIGADLLVQTLDNFEDIKPEVQNETDATYSPMIERSLCKIDWTKTAHEIDCQVRGLAGWPVALTKINGKNVKIHSGKVSSLKSELPAGEIIDNSKKIIVSCGFNTSYEITSLQLEGKKRMDSAPFLLGHKIEIGERLG